MHDKSNSTTLDTRDRNGRAEFFVDSRARCMHLQIHCIVKQPKNFDGPPTLVPSNAAQHEVPALVANSCHMQREYPFPDLAPFSCANCCRPGGQCHESSRKCVGTDARPVAPVVFESGMFALKGGTAINFFVRDIPVFNMVHPPQYRLLSRDIRTIACSKGERNELDVLPPLVPRGSLAPRTRATIHRWHWRLGARRNRSRRGDAGG